MIMIMIIIFIHGMTSHKLIKWVSEQPRISTIIDVEEKLFFFSEMLSYQIKLELVT